MHISVTRLTPHLHEHIKQSDQWTFTCTHQVHVNVQWPKCLMCAWRVRQLAHYTFSCTHQSLGSLPNYRTHQTIGSLHIYMHGDTCVLRVDVNVQRIRQLAHCIFSCTSVIGITAQLSNTSDSRITDIYMHASNVQWHVCLTCAYKCAESQTNCSVHIFVCTPAIGITAHLHEHIRHSNHCTFTCTHQVHVSVQWPECLTCACKCEESKTIGSLHIFMLTSVNGLTAPLHEHIRQSDHCTFTCTHLVHVNVQWLECLTCACICAESHTLGSLHIFMHISVIRLTPHLHEHIGQSDQCTFTCTPQVHVNVQWPECLTCACKCAESQTIGSLHIFMHTTVIGITAQLHELHVYIHTSGACKRAVTRVSDVCM